MNITSLHQLMPFIFAYDSICVSFWFSLGIRQRYSVSLSVPVLLSICLLLVVSSYTFTGKPVCDKISLVLSMISIITILAKLLNMVRGYITSFWFVIFSVCHSLSQLTANKQLYCVSMNSLCIWFFGFAQLTTAVNWCHFSRMSVNISL